LGGGGGPWPPPAPPLSVIDPKIQLFTLIYFLKIKKLEK